MERTGKNDVLTERAHYMCPNMHFGVLARIRAEYGADKVRATVGVLQEAHPFLRSLIAEREPGKLCYQAQERLEIPILEKPDPGLWQRDYDALTADGWNVRRQSMLKLLVYPAGEEFEILFAAHHLLCDGRGLLLLVIEFAEHYVRGTVPAFAEERLIASLDDLPAKSDLSLTSKIVIDGANRRWDREGRRVSYEEYLDFERKYLRENPVQREIRTVNGGELEKIQSLCRQQGVSVNDWLIAKMMLEEGTDKVVMAADIRDQLACYRQGALGNYSTAFSIVVKGKRDDLPSLAKRVAAQTASARKTPQKEMLVLACYLCMRPELLDAVAISSLGSFESASAAFVGTRMFGYGARDGNCVTNLGRIRSDVIEEAVFIPPASPANKTTWGVLTVNGRMKICAAVSEHAARQEREGV